MRRLLVVIALLLTAPADTQAAVCVYTPPPPKLSKAEDFLRQTMRQRKFWTLPHGRRYVQRVNADEANHRRGYLVLDFPMTAREAAYFERRQRLRYSPEGRALARYMRRHRDDFGEDVIEDDFPRPYLQLHVKRDLAKHRGAIRRFYPFRFKLERVRFNERELTRVAKAIDSDALEAEGIHVISYGVGSEAVELDVATTRPDVQDVVTRMYGPGVKVTVRGPTPTVLVCGSAESFTVSPDGRTLTVYFRDSGSITPKEIEVVEDAGEVRIGVVVESPYILTADSQGYSLEVSLASPLGERVVKNIRNGSLVPPL
jgi:hypothetical protein